MRTDKFKIQKFKVVALTFAMFLFPIIADAQCAMCRAALETSEDTQKAESVNNGIVYLMAIPYVLVAVLGYFVYRLYSKRKTS
ncbi:hypothetical protein HUK80_11945 [Flavobacterium sp. MAH-1]|uniref:Adenylosuccinate synthetase n=1 Tax=Flavobacterium agri TaxID=2743471 RepID=A0A7Y8Y365_9FLAO|nr:hypothetical protein [Flavobacterium agri]NUY81613.1 hypothetical protein [Flavobacterium agri]NYA71637.1 hypothetical protein [Flavobacterium agri]